MAKTIFWIYSLLLLPALVSCSDKADSPETPLPIPPPPPPVILFPEEDDSKMLTGNEASKFKLLIEAADPACALAIGTTRIREEEFSEIKEFTDNLVAGKSNANEVYNTIFTWVRSNIAYAHSDNDPYPVFKNRKGVCQGYANLLKIMLLSQDIPTLIMQGYLGTIGAHAWNYSYAGGRWIVGDPTNGSKFEMANLASYENWLMPIYTDIVLFEDEGFAYGYRRGLSLLRVKIQKEALPIPFGHRGWQVGTLYLDTPLPACTKELYLGSNIRNPGEGLEGLSGQAPQLENIFIAPNNPTFEDFGGVVYRPAAELPHYIPDAKETIRLKDAATIPKNTICKHQSVRELWFGPGTKTIESYAVEDCPALRKIHLSSGVSIAENAFYTLKDIELIYY